MGWLSKLFVRRGGPPSGTPEWDVQEAYIRFNEATKSGTDAKFDAWEALANAAHEAGAQEVLAAMVGIEQASGENYDAEQLPKAVHALTVAIYNLKYVQRS